MCGQQRRVLRSPQLARLAPQSGQHVQPDTRVAADVTGEPHLEAIPASLVGVPLPAFDCIRHVMLGDPNAQHGPYVGSRHRHVADDAETRHAVVVPRFHVGAQCGTLGFGVHYLRRNGLALLGQQARGEVNAITGREAGFGGTLDLAQQQDVIIPVARQRQGRRCTHDIAVDLVVPDPHGLCEFQLQPTIGEVGFDRRIRRLHRE